MAGTILSFLYSYVSAQFGVSSRVDLAGSRRLQGYGAPKKRRLSGVYPDDVVIGMWDDDGNLDWENGKYSNAPPARRIGIIVHIIGIMYMLVGLNTVCDIYFCGALDEMVEKWQVKPDVAGATFMAAGGSAPELFTSLIGACITEDDVGFGTIVGSAVFNVLAVIGCCGMSAKDPISLTWWPLFRDCTYYIFGLLLLAIFAYGKSIEMPNGERTGGGAIELYEAVILFLAYLIYCTIMVFNEKLEGKIQGYLDRVKGKSGQEGDSKKVVPIPVEDAADAKEKGGALREGASAEESAPGPPQHHLGADVAPESNPTVDAQKPRAVSNSVPFQARSSNDTAKHHDHTLDHHLRRVHHKSHFIHHHHHTGDGNTTGRVSAASDETQHQQQEVNASRLIIVGEKDQDASGDANKEDSKPSEESEPKADDASKASDESDEDDVAALVTKPEDKKDMILWLLALPIYAGLYYTLPRPSPKWFLATFSLALVWIAGFSFVLVYCVDKLGEVVFGGGDNVTIVMSFTLLAAGTSIPDLVSSMAVARAGEGDMAVSSSIGSNIFDILVGLPVPWMLKIGLVEMGINGNSEYKVLIKSPYIALYVFLLLFMVFMVIISIHFNKWQLNQGLGAMMGGLYVVFLGVVLPVELVNKGPYLDR